MKLKNLSFAISLALLPVMATSQVASADSSQVISDETWIVMEASIFPSIQSNLSNVTTERFDQVKTFRGMNIARVNTSKIAQLTGVMHDTLKRCGGFTSHSSLAEAEAAIIAAQNPATVTLEAVNYSINNQSSVNPMINSVDASQIASTIAHLSSYTNRFYKTTSGKISAEWIRTHWASLIGNRTDVTAELYQHPGWGQPSVILTIQGATQPDEVVVMGAHLDSTVGSGTGENTSAPGADDDASGVAVLTEAIRIMMDQKYKPDRTLKIMGYAAEEAGLLGSKEIAQDYKQQGVNVVGVIQFDMTNYHGSAKDLYIYTDYTNNPQNQFIADLLAEYQNVTVGNSQCGYGCSDHASWHGQGYPSSFPFESVFGEHNPNIHTANDTLANSDASGANSVPFAALALSYAGELAKGSIDGQEPPEPGEEVTETITGSVGWRDTNQLGSFDAKAGTQITVKMTGTSDADLYMNFGSAPTKSNWDCRPYESGSNETCSLTVPSNGADAFLMVYGYSWRTSNYTINVTYTKN